MTCRKEEGMRDLEPARTSADRESPLLLCARQELTLAVRSRWTQIFAAVFAALSLAVAASGYILSGGGGVQDFARTAASLVQLVLLLVPLTSLVNGVLVLSPDRGAAELLFSQPVSRRTILFGRLLGLFAGLAAAQAIGLGGAGLVIFWRSGQIDVGAYALLFAASLALTAIFLCVAAALASGGVGRRARSLALALIVWFAAVVLFDVAALGAATLLRSGSASKLLITATLVNPVDAVRTGTLLAIEGTTAFGAASLALLRATRGPLGAQVAVLLSVLLWTAGPLAVAVRRLGKADL
jgi:Cu-processing system permease protein